ncbi:Legume lectin domain [Dillenia turbinata]|uniref:Legume lectin domain n=1 Tax=Dillenia turbinata TaxID=194707 RepID=A0AAN8WG04_9MAGN
MRPIQEEDDDPALNMSMDDDFEKGTVPKKFSYGSLEFDTFQNTWDWPYEHEVININSMISVTNMSWSSSIMNAQRYDEDNEVAEEMKWVKEKKMVNVTRRWLDMSRIKEQEACFSTKTH